MNDVKSVNPNVEFILVATTVANPVSKDFSGNQAEYRNVIQTLTKTSVVMVDMTGVHQELLKYKKYIDMSGNNLNHPNDFLARWYAQEVGGLFFPSTATAPTLSSPTSTITSTSPQFVWYVLPGATRYWMTVAQADNTYLLNQEITPNCNTTTCWITPQLTLSPGKSYYFKVTAGITTGWGPASTANTFTVSSVGSSISSTSSLKPGDINGDGIVDIFDYNLLVTNFGKTGTVGFIPADINKDGKVDVTDYNLLVQSIKNTN